MCTVIIEANTRTNLIFSLSIMRDKINFKKIKKIILIVGHVNYVKPFIFDIIKFLKEKKIIVIETDRKNFKKYATGKIHSMYTFSFVPFELLKFKIFNSFDANIIRHEEGFGNYVSALGASLILYRFNFYFLAFRNLVARLLKLILNLLSLTKDEYLIDKKNMVNVRLKNLIIKTLKDIHKKKKKKKYDAIFCINEISEYKKFNKFIRAYNSVIVKPHPRFYNFFNKKKTYEKKFFYKGFLTSEELVFIYKIPTIWGFNSSTLIYCKILFNIKSFNIPFPKIKFSTRVKKIFKKFTLIKEEYNENPIKP
jgi:hypothetical protein